MKRFVALCIGNSEETRNCKDCWEGSADNPKSYRTAVWTKDAASAAELFRARNHDVVEIVEDANPTCPRCGGKLRRRTNYLGERFYCCSNYRVSGCRYTEDEEQGDVRRGG